MQCIVNSGQCLILVGYDETYLTALQCQQAAGHSAVIPCREPVTAVQWHFGTADGPMMGSTEEADLLISLGSDGRLLLWRWQTAELLYG